MQFYIKHEYNHYELLDEFGRFIESGTYEEVREAKEKLELQEDMKGGDNVSSDIIWSADRTYIFVVSALVAKARWIYKNGQACKVPVGEFRRELLYVKASSEEEAIKNIGKDIIARDVIILDTLDENQG